MMNKIIRTTLIALVLTFAAHAAAQQGLQIATAVSYTHLDVYKRQPTQLSVAVRTDTSVILLLPNRKCWKHLLN